MTMKTPAVACLLWSLATGAAALPGTAAAAPTRIGEATVQARPRCIVIARGSGQGEVADTSLFPQYPPAAFGDNQRISALGPSPQHRTTGMVRGLLKFAFKDGLLPPGA